MHLVTNEKLAQRRFRLGTAFHLAALGILGVGLLISLQSPGDQLLLLAPYVALLLFLIPYYFGKSYIQRYGPKNRQDAALAQATKGLDNRYTLINFATARLPDYLLIGPGG